MSTAQERMADLFAESPPHSATEAVHPLNYRVYAKGTWQRPATMLIADVEAAAPAFGFTLPASVAELRAALLSAWEQPGSPGDGPGTAPHVRGSNTSKAAARAVAPKLAGKRLALLRLIMQTGGGFGPTGGFTDNLLIRYVVEAYGWSPNTPRARRVELERGGWLEDSGERRSGSTVWRPTDKAWAWWREQQNGGAS